MSNSNRLRSSLGQMEGTNRLMLGVLLLLAVGLTLLAGVLAANLSGRMKPDAQTVDQRMIQVADQLQCPICEGQSVAFSNSPLAAEMRRTILEKLAAGENEAEITNYFVERYGIKILREPPRQGLNAWLWITPMVTVVVAVIWLVWTLWHMARTQRAAQEATDDAPELDDEVQDLLAQYDEELFAQ